MRRALLLCLSSSLLLLACGDKDGDTGDDGGDTDTDTDTDTATDTDTDGGATDTDGGGGDSGGAGYTLSPSELGGIDVEVRSKYGDAADDGSVLVYDDDGELRFVTPGDGEWLPDEIHDPGTGVLGLDLSPDGSTLAILGSDALVLWDLGTDVGTPVEADADTAAALAYSPDGSHLAVQYTDGTRLLRTSDGAVQHTVTGIPHGWSADGLLLVNDDDEAVLYDPADGGEVERYDPGEAFELGWGGLTATAGLLVVGGEIDDEYEAEVVFYDRATGTELVRDRYEASSYGVKDARFSPDGSLVAVSIELSRDNAGVVLFYDAASGDRVGEISLAEQYLSRVHTVRWDPDGETIYLFSQQGRVSAWDVGR